MRLYEGSIEQFRDDVAHNRIADILTGRYYDLCGMRASPSEVNSWRTSLNYVKNTIDFSGLSDNQIVVEYQLPYNNQRVDVLLFGKNASHEDNVVLIELKQWSNDNVKDCETDGDVIVNFGRFVKEQPHPALQVEGYHYNLVDFVTMFSEPPQSHLSSCAYCHNYSRTGSTVLFLPKFSRLINRYPLFAKEDFESLGTYLKQRLCDGAGLEVFNRFVGSKIRPSKKLLEHVGEMINRQQVFNLIDDQIVAYRSIMHKASKLSASARKSAIIVKGGPGTGKSVIALEVMAELLRQKKDVWHATGSSAFTNTLRKILGTRAAKKFKFFNSFTQHRENEIDVLICDEAHRIRKTSESLYMPARLRTGMPQIEELIRSARLSVFFIDEYQVVRPTEIGSIDLIKTTARKLGVAETDIAEFELPTQFRCNGSDTYLQWVENALGIRESEKRFLTKADRMDFRIVDSAPALKSIIDQKNQEKRNSARIVAGFCWPWSKPNPDGTLVKDVRIGDFEMPWEKKDQFWKWATDDSGMGQVGTVYTAQGFEFDYIGIIFGKDLVYDSRKQQWVAKPENSYDIMAKRDNERFVEHLKNVYRVLLSRAHKGCYVYFMDKGTEEFFRSRIQG